VIPEFRKSTERLRLLLLSNYAPDRQESMLRFAALLQEGFSARGHDVVTIQPPVLALRHVRGGRLFSKWAGYLDKLVLFPPRLRRLSAGFDVAHICDHSNAPYQGWLRSRATVVTCHDLLAVRGAMGEETYCPASGLGRRLQASILRNLAAVPNVACDSDATRSDFYRLTGRQPGRSLRTIRLGFSSTFSRSPDQKIQSLLASLNLAGTPYVLHVGSSQSRKNREGILKAVAGLGSRWSGNLVFVGERLRSDQVLLAADLGLGNRIRDLGGLSDETLSSIYAGAHAFLFPSLCEGFGWPILEAQACGCPVITADNTSLKEVAGDGAMIFDSNDTVGMGQAILQLVDPRIRGEWIAKGAANLCRFTLGGMLDEYENLYREALADVA
jgi:glycosyltransferase involved in cell wall biosynthesis